MLTELVVAPAAGLRDPDDGSRSKQSSTLRSAGHTFLEHRMAVVGLGFLLFVVLFCFVGPLVYKTDQVSANVVEGTLPPSSQHWLGTDESGFDVLGRLMVAGQTSLEIGLGAALVGATIGAIWGSVAGYFGGVIDSIMMRVVDAVLALPALLLLLVFAVIIQPSVPMLVIIVGVVSWLVPARLVRSETLTLKTREYVDASRIFGSSGRRTVARHILPNVLGTIIVNATFLVADAIILVAYLSFLGLGISPPATNWGAMLSDGLNYALSGYWWLIFPPGVAIILTVVAVNYVGDGLRDAFEVRLRVR